MMDANHPAWRIIRYAVVSGTMIILCSTLYKNGFDHKDIVLIVTTLLGLAGFDQVKTNMTKEPT